MLSTATFFARDEPDGFYYFAEILEGELSSPVLSFTTEMPIPPFETFTSVPGPP